MLPSGLFIADTMTIPVLMISWAATVLAIAVAGWFYLRAKIMRDKLAAAERHEQDAQGQLLDLQQQSSHDGQKKSRFIASAAHDLRQPLHALSMFSDALLNQPLVPEAEDIASKIHRSVNALVELFNALFDVAKLETGANEIKFQNVSLRQIVQVLDAEYSAQAEKKGLQWRCDVPEVSVRSDPVLLETILRNLLSNALRYTKQGGIGLYAKRDKGLLHIAISDTGVGIPQQRQEEIFQEFHQLDNMSRAGATGLGMGLSIVDRLIKLLSHGIDVQSEVGKGTTFTLTLSEGAALVAPTVPAPELNDLAGLRVLVIDDDPQVREGMQSLLQSWQCEVMLADGEPMARQILIDEHWIADAIISDYTLGKRANGVQVLASIPPVLNSQVPVLFISGDISAEVRDTIKAQGYLFLPKPAVPAQLRSFLRAAARRKSSAPATAQTDDSLNSHAVALEQLLTPMVGEYQAQAEEKGIGFECEYPAVHVQSDAALLETILRNLLNYAFKRTHQGSVSLRCERSGQGIRVAITDTGQAISVQTQALLQQYQAHPKTKEKAVRNLGLSLAFQLAHSLGHPIQVVHQHSAGLQFQLQLPDSPTP